MGTSLSLSGRLSQRPKEGGLSINLFEATKALEMLITYQLPNKITLDAKLSIHIEQALQRQDLCAGVSSEPGLAAPPGRQGGGHRAGQG